MPARRRPRACRAHSLFRRADRRFHARDGPTDPGRHGRRCRSSPIPASQPGAARRPQESATSLTPTRTASSRCRPSPRRPAPPRRPNAAPARMPDPGPQPIRHGQVIARHLPEGAIISDEGATPAAFVAISHAAPHDHLALTGGSIGQGVPLATGAAVASPGRKVVCLQGDGGAMYTLQALWTQGPREPRRHHGDLRQPFLRHPQHRAARVGALNPAPRRLRCWICTTRTRTGYGWPMAWVSKPAANTHRGLSPPFEGAMIHGARA